MNLEHIPATFRQPVQFCIFNIAWTYIVSVITGNLSQVDRVWAFLPMIYTAYYAAYPLFDWAEPSIKAQGVSPRAVLMLVLQIIWSIRLNYNAWRRGYFNWSEEDYRWPVFRKQLPNKILFQLFNFSFVAVAQNILLFLLGLPTHSALIREPRTLGTSDIVLAELALVALALEFTADNQQWSYQNFKRTGVINSNEWIGSRIQWTEDDKQRGFITRGLWAYSRHPNCACEQTFWYIMTLFPIFGSYHLPNDTNSLLYTLLPALSLGGLFLSSTIFTESISSPKYPEYKAYQSRVGMFWPFTTFFKGVYLWITGEKADVEQRVWGRVKGKRNE